MREAQRRHSEHRGDAKPPVSRRVSRRRGVSSADDAVSGVVTSRRHDHCQRADTPRVAPATPRLSRRPPPPVAARPDTRPARWHPAHKTVRQTRVRRCAAASASSPAAVNVPRWSLSTRSSEASGSCVRGRSPSPGQRWRRFAPNTEPALKGLRGLTAMAREGVAAADDPLGPRAST